MTIEERERAIDALKISAPVMAVTQEEFNNYIQTLNNIMDWLEQEPKTAYWVEEDINEWSRKVFCSECGCPPPFEHVSTGDVYSANGYGVINKTKFCPNCGRRMVNPEESEGRNE